jgi:hypothetical protein
MPLTKYEKTMKTQLTLGDLIRLLDQVEKPETPVRFDFARFKPKDLDSYRGYYDQLALGWGEMEKERTVEEMLVMCRQAVGNTFEGYKGGLYTMRLSTPLWVANYGDCHDTAIVGVVDAGWQVIIETAFQA